jgi:hypothetical protein
LIDVHHIISKRLQTRVVEEGEDTSVASNDGCSTESFTLIDTAMMLPKVSGLPTASLSALRSWLTGR